MKQIKLNKISKDKVKLKAKVINEKKEKKLRAKKLETYKILKKIRTQQKSKKIKSKQVKHTPKAKRKKQVNLSYEQLFLKNINDLYEQLEHELNIASFSIYAYSQSSNENIKHLAGDKESNLLIQKYLSFCKTTIFVNAEGINDNDMFKSRIILQLSAEDIHYLIIFSSYALETFKGENPMNIIRHLTRIKRKTGEEINEHGISLQQEVLQTI